MTKTSLSCGEDRRMREYSWFRWVVSSWPKINATYAWAWGGRSDSCLNCKGWEWQQLYRQPPGPSRMLYMLLNVHIPEENPSLPISLERTYDPRRFSALELKFLELLCYYLACFCNGCAHSWPSAVSEKPDSPVWSDEELHETEKLMPLSCPLRSGKNGKFYVTCILSQKKFQKPLNWKKSGRC